MEIGWWRRSTKRFFFGYSSQNAGNNSGTGQSCHESKNIRNEPHTSGDRHRPTQDDRSDSIEHTGAKKYYELSTHPRARSQKAPSQCASLSLASEASHHFGYAIEDKIQLKYEHDTITSDAWVFLTNEESVRLAAAMESARVLPATLRAGATVPASNSLHRGASSSCDLI